MPILPHHIQSHLQLSLVEPLRDLEFGYERLPLLSPSSTPRGMAQYNNFDTFEAARANNEPDRRHGNYATDSTSGDAYETNEIYHYNLGTPPEMDGYWPNNSSVNDVHNRMVSLDQGYLQSQANVASAYPTVSWGNIPSSSDPSHSSVPSNYAPVHSNPDPAAHAFGPYSNIHTLSPENRRSRSSELVRSPYATSSHLTSPPTTPGYIYGVSVVDDPVPNLDGHREQLRLFKDALHLPMYSIAGPFVPQKMYVPHTNSDRRRYVEETELQAPIYFWMHDPVECGIPLVDALHSRVRRLQNRDETVFEGRGPSISVRIQWPGYRPWSRQIPTKDFRSPPGPITRAKLAKNVAKCVDRFLAARSVQSLEDDADVRWKVGPRQNEIKLDDLILVSMHHVSMGSWQPHLRLRHPFAS